MHTHTHTHIYIYTYIYIYNVSKTYAIYTLSCPLLPNTDVKVVEITRNLRNWPIIYLILMLFLFLFFIKSAMIAYFSEKTFFFAILFTYSMNIYIYCHPQTDCFVVSQFFSVDRHARFSMLGLKPDWLKRQSKILPPSHEETNVSEGSLNTYVSHLFNGYRLLN